MLKPILVNAGRHPVHLKSFRTSLSNAGLNVYPTIPPLIKTGTAALRTSSLTDSQLITPPLNKSHLIKGRGFVPVET